MRKRLLLLLIFLVIITCFPPSHIFSIEKKIEVPNNELSFYGNIINDMVNLKWSGKIDTIVKREYKEDLSTHEIDVANQDELSENVSEDIITEFFGNGSFFSFIYNPNNKDIVAIIVLSEDYEELRAWLFSWMRDIFDEGRNVFIQTVRRDASPVAIRDYLKSISNLSGVELVGDIPIAYIKIKNPWTEGRFYTLPTNLFYQDLDSDWIDNDGDGIYDEVKGDPYPEIWCGTLRTGFVNQEENIIALRKYFERLHLYRKDIIVVPDRGLEYFDRSNKSTGWSVFNRFFNDIEIVVDPLTTRKDYLDRLSSKSYGFVYSWSHGSPLSQIMMSTDEKTRQGNVTSFDIREINPRFLFINLESCLTARFSVDYFLAGSYTFSKYPLLSIGWSIERGGPWNYQEFFKLVFSHKLFSEIQLSFLKGYKHVNDYPNNFYGYTYIGDPLIYVKNPSQDEDEDFISDKWEDKNGFSSKKIDSDDDGISDFDELINGKGSVLDNIPSYIFDVTSLLITTSTESINLYFIPDNIKYDLTVSASLDSNIGYEVLYPWEKIIFDPADTPYTDLKSVSVRLIGNRYIEFKVDTYRMGDPTKDFHINIVIYPDPDKKEGYILRSGNLVRGFDVQILKINDDGSIKVVKGRKFEVRYLPSKGEYRAKIRMDYLDIKKEKIGISVGINSWIEGKPNWDWSYMSVFELPKNLLIIKPKMIKSGSKEKITLEFDKEAIIDYFSEVGEIIRGWIVLENNGYLIKKIPFDVFLDEVSPKITLKNNASSLFNSEKISFFFDLSDNVSLPDNIILKYSLDGSEWREVHGDNISLTNLSEGKHTLLVKALDEAGNESEPLKIEFIVDLTPPKIEITSPQDNLYTNKDTITIKGSVSDSLSGVDKLTINGEEISIKDNGIFEKEVTLSEGENKIKIKAYDKAGNKQEKTLRVYLDKTPPELSVNIPDEVNDPHLIITGSVNDNLSGIKYLKINEEDITISPNGSLTYTITLNEGENTITFELEDKAGNKTDKTFTVNYIKRIILKLKIGSKTMYINDEPKEIDVSPTIVEGRTLLPIRWVAEPLGADIGWDGKERKVTVSLNDTTIELWIGKSTARVNGIEKPIDPNNPKVVPMIINGRTMLPVRFVAENLGCKVEWDGTTKTVTIIYPGD